MTTRRRNAAPKAKKPAKLKKPSTKGMKVLRTKRIHHNKGARILADLRAKALGGGEP